MFYLKKKKKLFSSFYFLFKEKIELSGINKALYSKKRLA